MEWKRAEGKGEEKMRKMKGKRRSEEMGKEEKEKEKKR